MPGHGRSSKAFQQKQSERGRTQGTSNRPLNVRPDSVEYLMMRPPPPAIPPPRPPPPLLWPHTPPPPQLLPGIIDLQDLNDENILFGLARLLEADRPFFAHDWENLFDFPAFLEREDPEDHYDIPVRIGAIDVHFVVDIATIERSGRSGVLTREGNAALSKFRKLSLQVSQADESAAKVAILRANAFPSSLSGKVRHDVGAGCLEVALDVITSQLCRSIPGNSKCSACLDDLICSEAMICHQGHPIHAQCCLGVMVGGGGCPLCRTPLAFQGCSEALRMVWEKAKGPRINLDPPVSASTKDVAVVLQSEVALFSLHRAEVK